MPARMQQLKAVFWAIDLALAAVAVFFIVNAGRNLVASPQPPPEPLSDAQPSARAGVSAQIKPLQAYASLKSSNLFGELASSNVAAQEVVEESLPETTLELELLGSVSSPVPELSFAIIRDKNARSEGTYAVGDHITGNATLEEIREYEVVISRAGQREILAMSFKEESPLTSTRLNPFARFPQAARQPQARRSAASDEPVRVINENLRYINRQEFMREIGASPGRFLNEFRTSPNIVEGKPQGVRVDQVGGGPLVSEMGVQPGDIVKSVNGIRVNSVEDVMENSARLENSPEIRLVVERDGRHRTLVYKIR